MVSAWGLSKKLKSKEPMKSPNKGKGMVSIAEDGKKPVMGKRKGNAPKISESQLQASFFTWFRLQYPQYYWNCFAVPNGGLRNKIVAAKLKREGATSGVWDVFLAIPNRGQIGMWIEFKVGYNKLTDNQQEFKDNQFTGYRWQVCHTIEEAIEAVKLYLSQ